MTRRIVLAALLCLAGFSAHAQNIVGDWQGTLHAGGADLRLVLHITKTTDGTLQATLDSLDQGATAIPVSSVTLKANNFSLDIDAVHGTFTGKINADASQIDGTWSQGQPLPLTFHRGISASTAEHKTAKPSDIDGDWWGTLDTGPIKLRLILHITNTIDGLIVTLDSPDQNMKGLPASSAARNGLLLKVEFQGIGGVLDANISRDLTVMDGTWTQGRTFPLSLKRARSAADYERRHPQNPIKPYPYREEDVQYRNKAAPGVTLAATLTIPQGNGPFPAVLLLTGSGPQDRDESILGHKPFLVLSDYLTRKGIAVLRADDRGFGKSIGSFALATTADLATDAEAGIAFLKSHAEIDPHKIGLIGHSEGGIIAAMVAARNRDVAFIVMLAGSGVRGDQVLVEQHRLLAEAHGATPEEAERDAAEERQLLTLVETEKDDATLEKTLRERLSGQIPPAQVGVAVNQLTSPWMRFFLTYDPAAALRKITCPVLALNGEKDRQVPPQQNLPPIRKALAEAGNKNYEVDELSGLNHLFQTAVTGTPNEYAEIEETISPAALEKISTWIQKQTAVLK